MSPDAHIIDICQQLLSIHQEKDALAERDPYAPDNDPNHGRYEVLEGEFAALTAALTLSARPATVEGIQALAQVAMTYAVRTPDGTLQGTADFADWLRLFVLTSAAGKPETIPPPRQLPRYWPRGVRRRRAA